MATISYLGSATAYQERYTATIGGTWVLGDTITVTLNTRTLVLTTGVLTTAAAQCVSLKEAWQSTTFTDSCSCLPIGGGTAVPEMSEWTATSTATTVVFTLDTAGIAGGAITIARTTGGTGTVSIAHTATFATGPNFYDNTANWDSGTLPIAGTDAVIDRPVSILYGTLDQSAVTLTSLVIGEKFTSGAYIGLPVRNAIGYEEYRQARLKIGSTTTSIYGTSGRIRLDNSSIQTALTQYGAATLDWIGTHASNVVKIHAGTAYLAAYRGELCTILTLTQTNGTVECGAGATLGTIIKDAGTLTIASSVATSLTSLAGTTTINGGTQALTVIGGGTLAVNGATILTTLRMAGGTGTIASTCGAWTTISKSAGTLTIGVGGTTLTSDSGITRVTGGNLTGTTTINDGSFYYLGTGTISSIVTKCKPDEHTYVNFDNGSTAPCTVSANSFARGTIITDTAKRVVWTGGIVPTNGTITFS